MPVDLLVLGGALLAGLFGGVHCLAMCGGIAVGFSAPRGDGAFRHALLLNLGRVGGYTLAGAIVGAFGAALLGLARIEGLALAMRMLVGAVLLLAAFRLLAPQRAAWRARARQKPLSSACSGDGCLAACRQRCSPPHGCRPARCTARC